MLNKNASEDSFQNFHMRINIRVKYDKQDQQGKAAFNERNPQMT
jgi:hypothetical protein